MSETKNKETDVPINWEYPEPRDGIKGSWDKFIGPGATMAELWLIIGVSLVSVILLILYITINNIPLDTFQILIAVLIAFDLSGGVVANSTSSAKRWYHRKETGFKDHFTFIVFHIHPFLVGLFFRNWDWGYGLFFYSYLLIASLIILKIPLYLQRPVALIFFLGAILCNLYIFTPTIGLEWFVPVFFCKLLIAHILREEPYRPENEKTVV
ncbi:MAG: hypothetical protein ACTSR3_15900 [Candidatus Helarchaeota archaeon]